jgi:hypothetical protein
MPARTRLKGQLNGFGHCAVAVNAFISFTLASQLTEAARVTLHAICHSQVIFWLMKKRGKHDQVNC